MDQIQLIYGELPSWKKMPYSKSINFLLYVNLNTVYLNLTWKPSVDLSTIGL